MPLSPDTTAAITTAPVRRGESIRGAFRDTDAAIHRSGGDPNQPASGGFYGVKKGAAAQAPQKPVDLDAIFNANYNTLERSQKPKRDDALNAQAIKRRDSPPQEPDMGRQARAPPSPPRRAALRPPPQAMPGAPTNAAGDSGSAARDFFARAPGPAKDAANFGVNVDTHDQTAPQREPASAVNRMGGAGEQVAAPDAAADLAPSAGHVTQDMLHRFESALERDISTVKAHAGLRHRHGIERSWRHADHCAACAGAPEEAGAVAGRRRAASAAVTRQEQRVLLVVEGQEPRASAMNAAIDAFVAEVARLTQLVEQAEADLNSELQSHAFDTSALQALERSIWDALEQLAKMFRSRHTEASTRTQALYDNIVPAEEACAAAERHLAEVTVTCGKASTLGMSCLGAAKRAGRYLEAAETHNADTNDCLQGVHDQMEQEQHARGIVCARLMEACDATAREVASAESALKTMRAQVRTRERDGGLTAELRCDGGGAAATSAKDKNREADSSGGIGPLFGRLATLERHCGHLSSAGAHLQCLKCATAAINREAAAVQRQLEHTGEAVRPAMSELDAHVAAAAHALETAAASRHQATFSSAALVGAVEVAQAFDAAEAAMQERADAVREMQQSVRQSISKARAERRSD